DNISSPMFIGAGKVKFIKIAFPLPMVAQVYPHYRITVIQEKGIAVLYIVHRLVITQAMDKYNDRYGMGNFFWYAQQARNLFIPHAGILNMVQLVIRGILYKR